MDVVHRNVESWAREVLGVSPVLVIEGARQVGKSTLVSMLGDEDTTYVTMDDDVVRGFAQRDPVGLLRSGGGRLVIDEIQRCPELILPLKMEVDRDRRPGRFVLTGSANLLRVPGAEDSLAGRAMTIRLHPFSQGELAGRVDDWVADVVDGAWSGTRMGGAGRGERADVVDRLVRGGHPPVQGMSDRLRTGWLSDYVDRLLERDAQDIGGTQVALLCRMVRLIAAAPGAELVMERMAETLGCSRPTALRHLEVLESLFLVQRLPAWSRNLTGRQVQRPRTYLTDTGLVAVLASLTSEHLQTAHGSDHLGPVLENFVVSELLRQRSWTRHPYDLFHFRDRNGSEVDVVIETPRGVIGVEVKAATAARSDHFKHLVKLRDKLGGEFLAGIVLTLGDGQPAGDRLMAMPVSTLWGSPA